MNLKSILPDDFFYDMWDYVSGNIVHDYFFNLRNDYLRELTYSLYRYQDKQGYFNLSNAAVIVETLISSASSLKVNFGVEEGESLKLFKQVMLERNVPVKLTEEFISASKMFSIDYEKEDPARRFYEDDNLLY